VEPKRIDIKEFRELGILHEINRLFLHPLGLALEVEIDDETGEEHLGGIWDCRDDPEGILYQKLNTEKMKNYKEFRTRQWIKRLDACGWIAQVDDIPEKKKVIIDG